MDEYKVELEKINAKLGLNPEAKHESRIMALETVLAKAKMSDDKRSEMEDKLDEMKKACTKSEKESEDLKAKIAKMEDKIKADDEARAKAEDKKKGEDAKDMIAGYVAKGVIKNDEKLIAAWETKACADMTGIKDLLESMPINKQAPKPIAQASGTAKLGSIISRVMGEAANKMTTSPVGNV